MERPNLLYIFTDQQSAHMMSCAGNPHLRTPAMDRQAEGREVEWRDHTVVETVFGRHSHPSDGQGRAVIGRDWKYTAYNQSARREQLFRIREDPGERENRALDASCAEALARHRELLQAWRRETDDDFPGTGDRGCGNGESVSDCNAVRCS